MAKMENCSNFGLSDTRRQILVTAIIVFMGALVIIAVVASLKHGTENRKINV